MTDEDVEKIIKQNMNLQMNLAGIRADFEDALQRTWVGLTDLENAKFVKTMERGNFLVAIYDIEKRLKEKNT